MLRDLNMDFDLDKFAPAPNNWFNANIEYEGHGRAEFLDPKGIVEGSVKINFDEFGKDEITMNVESSNSGQVSIYELLHQNTCESLEVTTTGGVFFSISDIYYDEELSFHVNKGSEIKLKFHVLRSIFRPNRTGSAYYWVLPLSNFVSRFMKPSCPIGHP